ILNPLFAILLILWVQLLLGLLLNDLCINRPVWSGIILYYLNPFIQFYEWVLVFFVYLQHKINDYDSSFGYYCYKSRKEQITGNKPGKPFFWSIFYRSYAGSRL